MLNTEVFLFPTGANTNAGVKINHLAVANHTNVQLDRLEHTEDGELLQERTEQFSTDLARIREGVLRVLVGHHDIDGEFPHLSFEQVIVDFNAKLLTDRLDGIVNQTNDVVARKNVVSILMVDLVHDGVDDEQGDDGQREGNEGHPPCRNTSGTAGEHGGFATAAQFSPHQNVAPIAQILNRPTRTRSGVFDSDLGVFVVVNEGQEGQGLFGKRVLKFDALGYCLHGRV